MKVTSVVVVAGNWRTANLVTVSQARFGPRSITTGDFNGDGKLDLAVPNSSSNNVSVRLGKGDGTFKAAMDSTVGQIPGFAATGDFNGDTKPDLVVTNLLSEVSLLLGNGDGSFNLR